MFMNSLLRVAVVFSVVWCTTWDRPSYVWVPVLLIVVFVVKGVVASEGVAERIDALGDQTYFLAYSATASALLGLLGRVYKEGGIPNDLRPVEIMGAIALSTTIIGLIAMITLKEYAQSLTDDGPKNTGQSGNSGVSDSAIPTPTCESPDPNHKAVQDTAAKATLLIADIARELEKLPVAVNAFASAIQDNQGITEDFIKDVRELHSVLDEWERLQERSLDDLSRASKEQVQ